MSAAPRPVLGRRRATRLRLVVTAALAALVVLVALLAPLIVPHDPNAQDLDAALRPPSAAHWAGTDRYGRDLASRVIVGSRVSVMSALALVAVVSCLGTLVGICCALGARWLDDLLMRTSDVFLAFPGLVFAMAASGIAGGGIVNAAIALALIGWPKYARLARTLASQRMAEPYMDAARLSGCTTAQLVVRHLLPNMVAPVLVTATLDISQMMMELAGLSFLGLGAKPPVAEWGQMMSDGRSLLQTAPWCVLAPGAAIFLTVVVFNLLGDTMRDHLDKSGH